MCEANKYLRAFEASRAEYFQNLLNNSEAGLKKFGEDNDKNLRMLNSGQQQIFKILDSFDAAEYADSLEELVKRSSIQRQCAQSSEKVAKLKAKLVQKQNELEVLQNENKKLEDNSAELLKTYKKVYKYHASKFDFHLSVDHSAESMYVSTLRFGKKSKYPVKFTIDRENRKVVDFDASSLMSSEEEQKLKDDFKESSNVLKLVCTLRGLVVSKENKAKKL